MEDKLFFIGLALIIVGIILITLAPFFGMKQAKQSIKKEIAVGGFIGPIPFGFFSSKQAFFVWLLFLILALIFIIVFIILKRLF